MLLSANLYLNVNFQKKINRNRIFLHNEFIVIFWLIEYKWVHFFKNS